MAKPLVIVESPNKIAKLRSIIGTGYDFQASVGHFCDLSRNGMSVDMTTFEPQYVINPDKKDVFERLQQAAKNASVVYLASDLDREGEAIAWHLREFLKLTNYKRIVFNEITESALKRSFQEARDIDMDLVMAQHCRRVTDRLIGYSVSPALTELANQPLSVGRVQSVAVMIIVEREQEIASFKAKPYFEYKAVFDQQGKEWSALWDYEKFANDANINLVDDNSADEDSPKEGKKQKWLWTDGTLLNSIKSAIDANPKFDILSVKSSEQIKNPPSPLTTSLLQQAANTKLGFSTDETMRLAQSLFEAGLITYHRTDSKNLSDEAITEIRAWIQSYATQKGITGLLPEKPRRFENADSAQEAHEAIRPSHIEDDGSSISDAKARQLYELIRNRAIASQMAAAIYDATVVKMKSHVQTMGHSHYFTARGRVLRYSGWLYLTTDDAEDSAKTDNQQLPLVVEGETYQSIASVIEQKNTAQPKRFTEASLVKTLERHGVGRPATYASIIKTILGRQYVVVEKRMFQATRLGVELIRHLKDKFQFLDINYTSAIELDFDAVAHGKKTYFPVVSSIYEVLKDELAKFKENADKFKVQGQSFECHECGKPLRLIRSKTPFWACSGYPDCKVALPNISVAQNNRPPKVNGKPRCPSCGGVLAVHYYAAAKRIYFKCSSNSCGLGYGYKNGSVVTDDVFFQKTSDHKCPDCMKSGAEGYLIKRFSEKSKKHYWKCSNQQCGLMKPDLDGVPNLSWEPPQSTSEHVCPKCSTGRLVVRTKKAPPHNNFWVCNNSKCNSIVNDLDGKPDLREPSSDHPCPMCQSQGQKGYLMQRDGYFSCSNESCRQTVPAKDGLPDKAFMDKLDEYAFTTKLDPAQLTCDACKKGVMKLKVGTKGFFLACNKYPKCKNTKPI